MAYDLTKDLWTCVTWGGLKQMTGRFVKACMSEAYALLDSAWFNNQHEAPSGFNLTALQADLAAIH